MALSDRHTTDRHSDLETESGQWANSVKISLGKKEKYFYSVKNNVGMNKAAKYWPGVKSFLIYI